MFEVPRLKLVNGLFRTKESPTSLPAAAKLYDRRAAWDNSFIQGRSAEGRWGSNKHEARPPSFVASGPFGGSDGAPPTRHTQMQLLSIDDERFGSPLPCEQRGYRVLSLDFGGALEAEENAVGFEPYLQVFTPIDHARTRLDAVGVGADNLHDRQGR
jgi:hypothetical protein